MICNLRLIFDETNKTIKWETGSILLRHRDSTVKYSFYTEEPELVEQESEKINGILVAKYAPANLNQLVKEQIELNDDQRL